MPSLQLNVSGILVHPHIIHPDPFPPLAPIPIDSEPNNLQNARQIIRYMRVLFLDWSSEDLAALAEGLLNITRLIRDVSLTGQAQEIDRIELRACQQIDEANKVYRDLTISCCAFNSASSASNIAVVVSSFIPGVNAGAAVVGAGIGLAAKVTEVSMKIGRDVNLQARVKEFQSTLDSFTSLPSYKFCLTVSEKVKKIKSEVIDNQVVYIFIQCFVGCWVQRRQESPSETEEESALEVLNSIRACVERSDGDFTEAEKARQAGKVHLTNAEKAVEILGVSGWNIVKYVSSGIMSAVGFHLATKYAYACSGVAILSNVTMAVANVKKVMRLMRVMAAVNGIADLAAAIQDGIDTQSDIIKAEVKENVKLASTELKEMVQNLCTIRDELQF
ncbi:hypothetical protein HDU67_004813 [Dinochytrium kinnereticum]|nr:hypothetical protein HDU67_004813 [Dinochytrium kinnereticum]